MQWSVGIEGLEVWNVSVGGARAGPHPCFPLDCNFCRQVWHGLRDAYDIKVEEKVVLRHRRVLDNGTVTMLRLNNFKN